ncbi:MAG TPA: hypothetical protein VGK25_02520 [Ignavibacteria bacterium]|jgi:DNA-directed RNA polymerase subunit RPC12/RpoP
MEDLVKNFSTELDKAFQSAYHAAKGGDDNWNKVIEQYGAQPLTAETKKILLDSEMKIAKGAYPVELRRVYEKIVEKYSMQAGNDQNLPAAIKSFDMEGKVLEYYQKIKPFSGLGDIFKNASTGTTKYSQGLQKAKQHTYRCKNCGAPRLEEMQYDDCMFCGSKLFEKA